jgi:uncharacterized protein YcfJ
MFASARTPGSAQANLQLQCCKVPDTELSIPYPENSMSVQNKNIARTFAFAALLPLAMLTGQAFAQQYNHVQGLPRIEGFNIDEVNRLTPGTELNFSMYGTPGGLATLRITGAARNLTLVEIEAGQYEGTYTISSRDRIAARGPVTANLRLGNQVASTVLDESLLIGLGYHPNRAAPGPQPRIESFSMAPAYDLNGGSELRFKLQGTPGANVDLVINGVRGKIILPEVARGEYAGAYTIRNRDRIAANTVVTANLRVGDRIVSTPLGQPLQSQVAAVPAPTVQQPPQPRFCGDCGTVEAINLIETKGQGSYLGTIGGGVVGALLGSQVGGGNGRTAAEIAGAVGGAYAGNAIEGNSRKTTHYEVLVRFQTGANHTYTFASDPGYRVGDKVRSERGTLIRNP